VRPPSNASLRYGLGYSYRELAPEVTFVGHSGANQGWMAEMGMVLESGDGFVVLTNGSFGGHVLRNVRCLWQNWMAHRDDPCRGAIGPIVVSVTLRDGVDAAVARYRTLRSESPDAYAFDAEQLNGAGYGLLGSGRIDDAIAVFELNVEMFPDAGNPWDSLGEAHAAAGHVDRAIECYAKAVELDPSNVAGARILEELRGKAAPVGGAP
jgi:tetratricopeptide (TPR) repeat protein